MRRYWIPGRNWIGVTSMACSGAMRWRPRGVGIIREAREGRLPPGQGQLPLAGLASTCS
ncbi:hypothetical protein [Pseudomonas fluorescens]|uniref:hypothetical protein n=1 Tax=Pseudomonas fluorescens TaxID=294 RepID=UPI00178499C0|nr:hypothetical protein [Pseudomonas fluorescens]